jgi:hypothetical protein
MDEEEVEEYGTESPLIKWRCTTSPISKCEKSFFDHSVSEREEEGRGQAGKVDPQ